MESKQDFFEKNRENLDHTRAAYAMCENIDWNVGRLLEQLSDLNDLAGLEVFGTKPLDGIRLKPLLTENVGEWPERTFFHLKGGEVSVRTQRYRLDAKGQLFDMVEDGGQQHAINDSQLKIAAELQAKADAWLKETLDGYGKAFDKRSFIIGHPDASMCQIPARDGRNRGGITRSTKYPNASCFTNWSSTDDSIVWDCEVGQSGRYKVELFYTCPKADVGSTIQLSFNDSQVTGNITEPHDPPLEGMEHDRVKRRESYTKDWSRMTLGEIDLTKGKGTFASSPSGPSR